MIPSLGGMLSRWVEIRLISYFRNGYGIFFIRTRAQRTYCEEAWTAWSTQCQVSSGCWDYGKPCLHISALKKKIQKKLRSNGWHDAKCRQVAGIMVRDVYIITYQRVENIFQKELRFLKNFDSEFILCWKHFSIGDNRMRHRWKCHEAFDT